MDIDNIRGIVIRAVDYGETSKILTVFSYEKGIISVMARGAKNPKSKKLNLISIFTEVNFDLRKSKQFYYLNDGEIIEYNFHIRENIKKIYLIQMFFDIIERTTFSNEENKVVYELLIKTIKYFNLEDNYLKLSNMFLIKYISMLGYKPVLNQCAKCGKKEFIQVYFSLENGGILCEDCKKINNIRLSFGEYKYLCDILLEVFENTAIIKNEIDERKIFKLLIDFIRYNTDISIPNSYKSFIKLEGIE